MSIVLATALLVSVAKLPMCSWDRPGQNPYMGSVPQAIDRYTHLPLSVREDLKQKVALKKYDDVAEISRDQIKGKNNYVDLRNMHFGPGQVCQGVTRLKWGPKQLERGLVYCSSNHCIIIPTVCRNVSEVTRVADTPLEFETAAGPQKSQEPTPQSSTADNSPLDFETAAGPRLDPRSWSAGSGGDQITLPTIEFPTYSVQSLPPLPAPAIPEPKTSVLILLGLSVIIISLRRNHHGRHQPS